METKQATKKRKEPSKPRGAKSAYNFFQEEQIPLLRTTGVDVKELNKRCGELWRTRTADQKKKYEELAAKDRLRYAEEMKNWKPSEQESSHNHNIQSNSQRDHTYSQLPPYSSLCNSTTSFSDTLEQQASSTTELSQEIETSTCIIPNIYFPHFNELSTADIQIISHSLNQNSDYEDEFKRNLYSVPTIRVLAQAQQQALEQLQKMKENGSVWVPSPFLNTLKISSSNGTVNNTFRYFKDPNKDSLPRNDMSLFTDPSQTRSCYKNTSDQSIIEATPTLKHTVNINSPFYSMNRIPEDFFTLNQQHVNDDKKKKYLYQMLWILVYLIMVRIIVMI